MSGARREAGRRAVGREGESLKQRADSALEDTINRELRRRADKYFEESMETAPAQHLRKQGFPQHSSQAQTNGSSLMSFAKNTLLSSRVILPVGLALFMTTVFRIFSQTSLPEPTPIRWIPGEVITNGIGMNLKLIAAGEFEMGSNSGKDDEKPVHYVKISREFYLGVTEVTQGQWKAVMGTEPWSGDPAVRQGSDYPSTHVSWDDAVEFCLKLTDQERLAGRLHMDETYRLPTEAEWEYTCRAGTTSEYSFGNDVSQLGTYDWYGENTKNEPYAHQVRLKRPNSLGLYDMHGNVVEWCSDKYGSNFFMMSPSTDPVGPESGDRRVVRGGSYYEPPVYCRSANRAGVLPSTGAFFLGFRVVCSQSR